MLSDRSAFISYKLVHHLCVQMGNNSNAPVLGQGMAIVSLNGKCLMIRMFFMFPPFGSHSTGSVPTSISRVVDLSEASTWGCMCTFRVSFIVFTCRLTATSCTNPVVSLLLYPLFTIFNLGVPLSYIQPRALPFVHVLLLTPPPVLIEDDGSLINTDRPSSLVDDSALDLPTFTSLVAKQVHQTPSKISRQAIGLSFLSNFRFC